MAAKGDQGEGGSGSSSADEAAKLPSSYTDEEVVAAAAAAGPVRDAATGVWRRATRAEAIGTGEGTRYLGELDAAQWAAVESLRAELGEDVATHGEWAQRRYNDLLLCRFLRARQFDEAAAAELARADMTWRAEFFAEWGCSRDRFLAEWGATPENQAMHAYWPGVAHGVDQTEPGRMAVWWERSAQVDGKSFVATAGADNIMKFHCWLQEQGEVRRDESLDRLGRYVDRGCQVVLIEDLSGLGMKHMHMPAMNLIQALAAVDENYYAETLKNFYLINVPRVFSMFWKMIKGWLDPRTAAKFKFFKADEKEALLEDLDTIIGRENIPDFIGADGGCTKCNPCVPAGGIFLAGGGAGASAVTLTDHACEVAARELDTTDLVITEVGATVSWTLSVQARDVDFAIKRKPLPSGDDDDDDADDDSAAAAAAGAADDDVVVIEENARRAEADNPHTGSFTVDQPGTYAFVVDNSFSRMRGKEARLVVTMTSPAPPSGSSSPATPGKKKKGLGGKLLRRSLSGKTEQQA